MNFELTGTIHQISDTREVSDKFRVREFVINHDDNGYEQFIKFQLTQDKCNILDQYTEGQSVTVHFNIHGKKYEKSGQEPMYFNNLTAWKIDGGEKAAPKKPDEPKEEEQIPDNTSEDLPF